MMLTIEKNERIVYDGFEGAKKQAIIKVVKQSKVIVKSMMLSRHLIT